MQPTIVLVHGAFAESSSWDAVIDPLLDAGHPVIAAANPLRGLAADAASVADVVRAVEGPVVLAATRRRRRAWPPDHHCETEGSSHMSADSQGEPVVAEAVIAQVLGQAHRTAEAQNAPNEERVILHVARSFADELAQTDPEFDRERFMQASTDRS
jgi:hypothetical protein